ncbi:MAG TPA: hypothetical protein DHV62_09410, partial [Elusimicrobia bacterium]|nr:hypothetical protein [Elusimicrobiota bacterium]
HLTPYTFNRLYGQQVGVGIEFSPPEEIGVKKKGKRITNRAENPFLIELAERFTIEDKELNNLHNRGYGYVELIKIILISERADKPLEEVVKKRDKGKKMRKIAEDYKLDYREIYLEALKIRKEIDNSLETGQPLIKSTTTPIETRESEQSPEK